MGIIEKKRLSAYFLLSKLITGQLVLLARSGNQVIFI
jgi:hypothetical protein